TRIGRTLGTLRAVLLTGTTGNNANVARAGIALAGGHERLTLARFAGFTRRFRLGRRRSGFCSAAGFLGLAAFFFLASSFFADLTTTVFVLDAARLFSGKAFAILGLASASQSQRLTAGFGFSRAKAQRRAVLLLHRATLSRTSARRAGATGTGRSLTGRLGHDARALLHDHCRARRSARHPAGAVAEARAALQGQRLL